MQASIPVGTLVGGRWEITGVLGEGGFGQVLLAVDTSEVDLGEAAVKVLHPNTTPQERADFLTEVKKIAALRHPNLVGYLDSGQIQLAADGVTRHESEIRPFLVTERCALSLSDHGRRSASGTLPPAETLSVLADVAAGLAHLHAQGLIHRDIKPGNVLWAEGRWKLADFGLMRDLSATGSYHRAGTLIGTPLFMAPELFSEMAATPASDIYAMGVLAHVCAAGRHLHAGAGPLLVHNVATQPPTVDPTLPPALHNLVIRCTHPDPTLRPTAAELVSMVAAAQRGEVLGGPAAAAPTQVTPRPFPAPLLGGAPSTASGPAPVSPWPDPVGASGATLPSGPPPASPYGPPPVPSGPTAGGAPLPGPYGQAATPSGPTPYGAPAYPTPYGQAPTPSGPAPAGVPGPPPGPGGIAPSPSSWPYGPTGTQAGGPVGSWAPPPASAAAGAVDGPAPRPRLLVLLAGSVAGLVLVGALGAGLWALTGGGNDSGSTVAGGPGSSVVVNGTGVSTPDVQIGGNVTVGPNVATGSGATATGGPIDARSHLVGPACEGGTPGLVQVVNTAAVAVSYDLHAYQYDAGGVRIGESYDSVTGVDPGQGALLSVAGVDGEAATCQIDTFTATPIPASTAGDSANVEITACDLDTFFGDYYDITFNVTNPGSAEADATITFSVVDANGVIIDQSFEKSVYAIAPGGTVKDQTGDFYNNIELTSSTVDHCEASAVSYSTP